MLAKPTAQIRPASARLAMTLLAIANPVITSPAANAELAAGVVHFAGTGQADSTIRISGNNQPLGEAKADTAGNWQADIDLPAADKLEIVAQTLDANGAVAAASTAFAVKVNGAAVAAAAEPTATAEAVATATSEVYSHPAHHQFCQRSSTRRHCNPRWQWHTRRDDGFAHRRSISGHSRGGCNWQMEPCL